VCTSYGYDADATCLSAHIVTLVVHQVAPSAFNIGGNVQISGLDYGNGVFVSL
jgi:hypothetical protein